MKWALVKTLLEIHVGSKTSVEGAVKVSLSLKLSLKHEGQTILHHKKLFILCNELKKQFAEINFVSGPS